MAEPVVEEQSGDEAAEEAPAADESEPVEAAEEATEAEEIKEEAPEDHPVRRLLNLHRNRVMKSRT